MDTKRRVKLLAISDTHGRNDEIRKAIDEGKEGDFFIHAGDFTSYNKRDHFAELIALLPLLKFKHKIVIPGNHELILDASLSPSVLESMGIFFIHEDMKRDKQIQRLKDAGALFLDHDYVEIDGVRIFASSYTPKPFYAETAFQIDDVKMEEAWGGVPGELDILITHGPPFGILDQSLLKTKEVTKNKTEESIMKVDAGSKIIRDFVEKSKVQVHIFGHIHDGKGQTEIGNTRFYNVAQKLNEIDLWVDV